MATFRKLFPADWFSGFQFPMIEDLINRQPFTTEHSPILDTDLQFAAYMHA